MTETLSQIQKKPTWKRYFRAKSSISEPIKVKLGETILHLEPKDTRNVTGYYQFTCESNVLERGEAREKSESEFLKHKNLLALKGSRSFRPKWTNLIPMNKMNFPVIKYQTFRLVWDEKEPVTKFTRQEFESLSELIKKLQESKDKKTLNLAIKWLFEPSNIPTVAFFYKWISFNILYNVMFSKCTGTNAIRSFGEEYSKDLKRCELFANKHRDAIKNLQQLQIISSKGKNYSHQLKQCRKDNNHKGILINVLLCIYTIR